MSGRVMMVIAGVMLLLAVAGLWAFNTPQSAPNSPGEQVAIQPAVNAGVIEARLAPVVDAARTASDTAVREAGAADGVALAADKVAASAASFAADAKGAAGKAREAAAKACEAPDIKQGCAGADDGTRYEGAQKCRSDGCGPEGYGVFTDARRGWESQGKWENWALVLGCDLMKGVVTFCGQQLASEWTGYGVSYNAEAAAISARWLKGAGQNPIQLDYPSGSRMRGEMVDYELDGLGIYQRSDARVLRGRWRAGQLVSGVVVYPGTGDSVSGTFLDGNAQSGSITYRDGRVFFGDLQDSTAMAQARPARGVLYAPDGHIEAQGVWRNGSTASGE